MVAEDYQELMNDQELTMSTGLGGPQQQASPDSTSPSATEGTDSGSTSLLHPQELRTDQELEEDLEEDHEDELNRGQTPGSGHKKRKRRVLFSKVSFCFQIEI